MPTVSEIRPVSLNVVNTDNSVTTVSATNPLPVSLGSGTINLSGPVTVGNEVEIKNDTGNPVPIVAGATRTATTYSIPSAGSVTPTIDLASTALLGFIMPAAWTSAALNIEVSVDNSTWITSAYSADGSLVSSFSTVTVSTAYAVDTLALLPYRYVRLRSGTSATPVVQSAQRDFTVITRPLA